MEKLDTGIEVRNILTDERVIRAHQELRDRLIPPTAG